MSVIELLAASPGLFIGTCLVLGLVVGSFLNVVIHRLPLMLERQWREQCAELAGPAGVARPCLGGAAVQSRRAALGLPRLQGPDHGLAEHPARLLARPARPLRAVPQPISVRYPLVELLTGVAVGCGGLEVRVRLAAAAAGLVLTWFLVALTFIDIDHQLLPDNLTLPLLWLGLAASLWLGTAARACRSICAPASSGAMAGYLSLWSVYHLFRLVTGKEGMGTGTSSCSRRSAPGSAGRCCCRSSSLPPSAGPSAVHCCSACAGAIAPRRSPLVPSWRRRGGWS